MSLAKGFGPNPTLLKVFVGNNTRLAGKDLQGMLEHEEAAGLELEFACNSSLER
jgi:hypothetical protein